MSETVDRAEATRARLVDAAVAAFSRKGFHGTTTRDIASAVGMSPAALYVHMESKEELLYLIAHVGHVCTLDLVTAASNSSTDPPTRLREMVRAFVRDHATNHERARVINYELAALDAEHARSIRSLRKAISQQFHEVVNVGVADGHFTTADPDMAANALMSLGIDIARWYHDEGSWSPEKLSDFYVGLAERIVGLAAIMGT